MITETKESVSQSQHQLIIYEMPLSDTARICLRLENLFQQFDKTINCTSALATKNAMDAVLKMLEVTDRPDIKSKLSQTLTQYTNTFSQFRHSPDVHTSKLQHTLKKLEKLNHFLHTNYARIGEPLRINEFLSQIRTNLSTPGGICDYRLPAYMLWQNKAAAEKTADLKSWMEAFQPLRDITSTLLQLTRDSTSLTPVIADNGFFLQPLNTATHCHLVRVAIAPSTNVYPEFSAGKHRVTIRFLTPSYFGTGKSQQTQQTVSFQLACCKV